MFAVIARTVKPFEARKRRTAQLRLIPSGLVGLFIVRLTSLPIVSFQFCGDHLDFSPASFCDVTGVEQARFHDMTEDSELPNTWGEAGRKPLLAVPTYFAAGLKESMGLLDRAERYGLLPEACLIPFPIYPTDDLDLRLVMTIKKQDSPGAYITFKLFGTHFLTGKFEDKAPDPARRFIAQSLFTSAFPLKVDVPQPGENRSETRDNQ